MLIYRDLHVSKRAKAHNTKDPRLLTDYTGVQGLNYSMRQYFGAHVGFATIRKKYCVRDVSVRLG